MSARLTAVRERIARAAEGAGRDPASVRLVAVSKRQDLNAIRELYDAGQRDFGENYVQEALPKIAAMPADCRWHFIGGLQSNKVGVIAQHFQVLQSVDRESQIRELAKTTAPLDVFIQVNVAQDEKKAGISSEGLDKFAHSLLHCGCVQLRGLMTIGIESASAEDSRLIFRNLRLLAEQLGLPERSMGMSADLEVAIQEGSTLVRIGTALFGPRPL